MTTKITRREMSKVLVTAGTGTLALGLYTWRVEPHWLEFSHPLLPISGLPVELEARTLAQISDIHVGPRVDDDYIIESFRRVQELAPDFVVFTGDFITYRGAPQFEQLRRVLQRAPQGRLGTVGILGNHDYGFHWRMLDVADRVTAIARDAGITLVRNQAVTLAGLQFIGLEDLWSPLFNPADLLSQKSHDSSTVVLCHNPDAADRPIWAGYQGWILSGHTHGGQCKPPFLPPPMLRWRTSGMFQARSNCLETGICISAAALATYFVFALTCVRK